MDVLKSILMYVNVACVAMHFIGKGPVWFRVFQILSASSKYVLYLLLS
jgi:hypothetical protein